MHKVTLPEKKPVNLPAGCSKKQMAERAQTMKRELGRLQDPPKQTAAAKPETELMTLEEYEREKKRQGRQREACVPAVNAWERPPAILQTKEPPAKHFPDVQSSAALPARLPEGVWAGIPPSLRLAPSGGQGDKAAHQAAGDRPKGPLPAWADLPDASQPRVEARASLQPPGRKLTKAQKKNLKRTEKKAQRRVIAEGSDAGSETSSATAAFPFGLENSPLPGTGGAWHSCMALLRRQKLGLLVKELQQLGFAEWQAQAAIARHGSDIERAASWLLEQSELSPEDGPSTEAAALSLSCEEEAAALLDLQAAFACSAEAAASEVLASGGCFDKAKRALRARFGGAAAQWHGGFDAAARVGTATTARCNSRAALASRFLEAGPAGSRARSNTNPGGTARAALPTAFRAVTASSSRTVPASPGCTQPPSAEGGTGVAAALAGAPPPPAPRQEGGIGSGLPVFWRPSRKSLWAAAGTCLASRQDATGWSPWGGTGRRRWGALRQQAKVRHSAAGGSSSLIGGMSLLSPYVSGSTTNEDISRFGTEPVGDPELPADLALGSELLELVCASNDEDGGCCTEVELSRILIGDALQNPRSAPSAEEDALREGCFELEGFKRDDQLDECELNALMNSQSVDEMANAPRGCGHVLEPSPDI
eukprot:CAMPEP_0177624404 /NCGR_PEP_ID=MMETSP0419_2-20121207/29473_1 /TAXON_ID=582737 /ORGANISM="Tetraselmis sp., Strain GSL018" /LENGTH=650 /DNA_ID=CAMNT_0019125131 /DNA_START=907 /DNA_END=2860 /DNA_ORIENTATION=-